ncbi:HAD family hydrolase [Clostridium isatidis]|uniref:HAD family hydrolase n=1 Tax=Clostridium isatidis TaxID=182773 RepID=UPI003AAF0AF3
MSKKGIVFFDVDGTLIDWTKGISKPTESTKRSIKKLKENGYITMLATGRPKNGINKDLAALNFDGYIGSNGAYIEMNNKVLLDEALDNKLLKEILEFLEDNKITYMLEGQNINYVADLKDRKLLDFIEGASLGLENFTEDWNRDTVKTVKIIVLGESEKEYKLAAERFKGSNLALMGNAAFGAFEIFDSKYSKGYGISRLLEILDIDRERTYAFGDGENDVEMFQVVKHGIAMGGYHKKLEQYAYDFTEDVKNEGITKGLEKLGLI